MTTPSHIPLEVLAPRGSDTLTIVWSDGKRSAYPHHILRGFCPCATCQGHQGPVQYREGGNLELVDIEEVGNYALRLTWGDGHATGIYSYVYLKRLEDVKVDQPVERT